MCLTVRVRLLPRRWLIVLALFVVTYGISTPLAAYGVFLPVLAEEFGWSRGAVSSALSLNLLLGGLAAFPIGTIADRRGPRLVLAALTVRLPAHPRRPRFGQALVDPRLWCLNFSLTAPRWRRLRGGIKRTPCPPSLPSPSS